jgi:NhaP-type Na+/H+ or K+/H+ antiporter
VVKKASVFNAILFPPMKRPGIALIASLSVILLTPFAVFPGIMTDLGPRNIAPWHNWLAIALLIIGGIGAIASLATIIWRRLHAPKPAAPPIDPSA